MSGLRFAVGLVLVLAVAAVGCGDDDDAADVGAPATTTTTDPSAPTADDPPPTVAPGVLELALTSDDTVPAGPHTWTLELRNPTDAAVDVVFPTSQPGDLVLRRDDGVVHRWSDGRFFTQQVVEETIEPGGALPITLEDDLAAVAPGSYEAEFTAAVRAAVDPVTTTVRVVDP